MKFLLVGLGNIGPEYALTRHNIGFMVLDAFAKSFGKTFQIDRHVYHTEISYKGKKITLIKPTTYMNLSGKAVNYWQKILQIPIENTLIITDDISLPFGKIRLREKGSHGGHNGLRNIQETILTEAYPRLRMGVGNDFPKGAQVEYVLGNFPPNELQILPEWLETAIEASLMICTDGIKIAMNQYNK